MSRLGAARIAIFDPAPAFTRGLIESIATTPDLSCVATATTESEARAVLARANPDIVILAALMPATDVAAFVREILEAFPRLKFLVLGDPWLDPFPARLIRAGVRGYLLKDCDSSELLRALRVIDQGKMYFTPSIATVLVDQIQRASDRPRPRPSRLPALTEREAEVLELLAVGRSNQSIAAELHVSVRTVENHVQRIYRKLGVHQRAQAVQLALCHEYVPSLSAELLREDGQIV